MGQGDQQAAFPSYELTDATFFGGEGNEAPADIQFFWLEPGSSTSLGAPSRGLNIVPRSGIVLAGNSDSTRPAANSFFNILGSIRQNPGNKSGFVAGYALPMDRVFFDYSFFGGSAEDEIRTLPISLTVPPLWAAITGNSFSVDLPASGDPFQAELAGGRDPFMSQFNLDRLPTKAELLFQTGVDATIVGFNSYFGSSVDENLVGAANSRDSIAMVGFVPEVQTRSVPTSTGAPLGSGRGRSQDSGGFLITEDALQSRYGGGSFDSFVAEWRLVVIEPRGIVGAADFAQRPIPPGGLLSFFARAIGPPRIIGLRLGPDGKALTQLGPTRVLFDGEPARMVFTSRNQSGTGQGAILNQNFTVNGPNNPEAPGRAVQIFLTGAGQTDLPGIDGELAPLTPPFPTIVAPVSVKIGGLDAKVVYRATPRLIHGVGQINALIPDDVAPGDAVSLEILIGDNASQPGITLAVGPAQ